MEVREQNALLKAEMFSELTRNVLPYWMNSMVDEKFGGFYGRRDGFDRLVENSPKAIILNTRILWTFAQAARQISTQYMPVADRAFSYLLNNFFDAEKGGVYWMLDHTGKTVETKKQVYAQAFAIYALSEYYLATQKKEALEKAIHLFELIEQYSFDPVYNGYLEAFDRDWKLLEDLRLSEKDANEKKTMNTHLHVLEAYTNLYRCWPDDKLRKQLRNLIIVFRDKIINNDLHFRLFFDERWNSRSNGISYGHDIEGSWLLYEAAEVLDDHDLLKEVEHLSVAMVDVAIRQGLDDDGGLMNEAHDADKHWWPQAEALVGLVNAWQLTSRSEYLDLTSQVWSFIKTRMIDRKHGEWYWRVDRDGNVNFSEDKAGPWKCPYPNGRAMLELLRRLG